MYLRAGVVLTVEVSGRDSMCEVKKYRDGRGDAMSRRLSPLVSAALVCVFIAPNCAWADVVTVRATAGDAAGELSWIIPDEPDLYEASFEPATIFDATGSPIATLDSFSVGYKVDPLVSISFTATAGSSDTTFLISSALLTFPTLVDPQGHADASITLTDTRKDGATLTGELSGDVFQGRYNAGTVFAGLLGDTSVAGGSATVSEAIDQIISESVSSIQCQFGFTLSAHDQVSGVGQFEVVPVPVPGAALLGLLGMGTAGWRLRRRK